MKLLVSMLVLSGGLVGTATVSAAELPPEYQFVQDAFPGVEIDSVSPSQLPGFLEMEVGADVLYVSADGKYVINGDLYDLSTKENLTEARKSMARADYFDRFGDDESILFPAKDPIAEVLVFTDITCGYCRKLHRNIAKYNDDGISIRYVFFPRSGPNTPSWAKAEKVWCAKGSRQEALTLAKNDEDFESTDCDASIVERHYQVVQELGLTGTPALLTEAGQLLIGYRTPEELLKIVDDEF